MKKITFNSLLLLLIVNVRISNAQKGYIHFNAGYGFSFASQTIGTDITPNSITRVKGTFGKGINVGGALGYKFREHLSSELAVNYIIGSNYLLLSENPSYYPETIHLKGKMLKLIPAIKISVGEKATGYARIGLAMGIYNRIIVDDDYTSSSYQRIKTTEVYSGRVSFGLNTALGIEKMTKKNIGFFAEINSTSQTWSPKRSEYTKYEVNGVNKLSSLTISEKQFEYVSSLDPTITNPSTGSPLKVLCSYYSFSNIGIVLGIKIVFGKKDN
jgi:hypothetical protein